MGRPTSPKAATGVRDALIAKLRADKRIFETIDPRLYLTPEEDWPADMEPYVHPSRKVLADLEAGRAVNVSPCSLHGIVEDPHGYGYSVRVDVDGTVSPAPYERVR
jgi:hypothetical protein